MGDFDNWRGNSGSDLCDPRQNRRGNRDLRYLCCDLGIAFLVTGLQIARQDMDYLTGCWELKEGRT